MKWGLGCAARVWTELRARDLATYSSQSPNPFNFAQLSHTPTFPRSQFHLVCIGKSLSNTLVKYIALVEPTRTILLLLLPLSCPPIAPQPEETPSLKMVCKYGAALHVDAARSNAIEQILALIVLRTESNATSQLLAVFHADEIPRRGSHQLKSKLSC